MTRLVFVLLFAFARLAGAQSPPEVVRDCPTCPEMVRIEAGSFMMGIPEAESRKWKVADDSARPVHQVTFAHAFLLGRYDVTRGAFAAFVTATNYRMEENCWRPTPTDRQGSWHAPGFSQTDDDPVVCVNARDAESYIAWLRETTGKPYRLPTEAEWEYAARAGTATAFYWGETRDFCRYANIADRNYWNATGRRTPRPACTDGYAFTSPVASYPANPWGLFDMAGNVSQWTADCYVRGYAGAPADGAAPVTGEATCERVVRGGSWGSLPEFARTGARYSFRPEFRSDDIGFRVARDD